MGPSAPVRGEDGSSSGTPQASRCASTSASGASVMKHRSAEPGAGAAKGVYRLTEVQAKAILDLRLQRLTGLEREKIASELKDLVTEIGKFLEILRSRERLMKLLREELVALRSEFATPRRTELADVEVERDIEALREYLAKERARIAELLRGATPADAGPAD